MRVDAQHVPADATRQPVQQGPAQTDGGASAQTLRVPADPVANGYMNTFILVIALLVGHIGDQFLVDAALDVGQIDGLHSQSPSRLEEASAGAGTGTGQVLHLSHGSMMLKLGLG